MKIVQINASYGSGSTGEIVKEISNYLTRNQIDNLVFCARTDKFSSNVRLMGNGLDHKVHALLSRLTGLQGYYSTRATIHTLCQVEDFAPDIVHIHNIHSNYVNYSLLFRYLAGKEIKTIITLHDCFPFTGKCMHYTMAGCNKWKAGCQACPQWRGRNVNPSWFFDRSEKAYADKRRWYREIEDLNVIGVSNWITEEAKKSMLSCAKRIRTIYNGIDVDKYQNIQKENHEGLGGKKYILSVATCWSEEKGIGDLLKLAEIMAEYTFVIIGKSRMQSVGNLLFAGAKYGTELAQYYSNALAFFHPSRQETFGLVIAEAMACGTPVVVYNSTACPEIVGEGCGYVVEAGDVEAVKACILEIDKNGKAAYSEYCRQHAINKFDKKSILTQILALYKEIYHGV